MDDSSNPSKKPRLDQFDEDQDSDDTENVWGQINFTAEELDLLEERGTQEVTNQENEPAQQTIHVAAQDMVQSNSAIGHASCFNVGTNGEKDSAVLDKLKMDQYALEGKNKALSELLSKTLKELNDERLNREQIIELKLAKFKQTEIDLHQEMDKLNTTLLFKDQELRTERGKIHSLENKLKQKASELQLHTNSSSRETQAKWSSAKKSPNKLPNWCSFDYRNKPDTVETEVQTEIRRQQEFILPLQAPRGKPRETDSICKLLSCRVIDSCCESDPAHKNEGNIDPMDEIFKRARDNCSMSVTTLRCNVESDNLWRPYELALQEYVSRLKTERSSLRLATERVCIFSEGMSHSNLNQQNGILSCLRSLTRLLFYQCPKGNCKYSKELNCNKFEKKANSEVYSLSSLPLFNGDEEKMDITQNHSYSLLELLIMLANPTTYPNMFKLDISWRLCSVTAHFRLLETVTTVIIRMHLCKATTIKTL